ncbi:MAG: hypothetical protein JRF54_10735 [Deltaproteobacteria bacterium]|nr:hypothetical protein [Deltaproteobacteria bacterium]
MKEGAEGDAERRGDSCALGAGELAWEAEVTWGVTEEDLSRGRSANCVRSFFNPEERRAYEEIEVRVEEDLLEHRELAAEGHEVKLYARPPVDPSRLVREAFPAGQVQAVRVGRDALVSNLFGEVGVELPDGVAAPSPDAEPIQEVESRLGADDERSCVLIADGEREERFHVEAHAAPDSELFDGRSSG